MALRNPLEPPADGHQVSATAFGYTFKRPDLLAEALTHRSAVKIRQQGGRKPGNRAKTAHLQATESAGFGAAASNERLEFVGDRVLGLVVAEWVFERFPLEQEGSLARRHAHLVARPLLA